MLWHFNGQHPEAWKAWSLPLIYWWRLAQKFLHTNPLKFYLCFYFLFVVPNNQFNVYIQLFQQHFSVMLLVCPDREAAWWASAERYLFSVFLFCQETWYWEGDSSADAIVMSGVRCSGTELTLDQCLHHGKHTLCPKGGGRFAAGVSCTQSKKP